MILVGIIATVDENEVRPDLLQDRLDLRDQAPIIGDLGVLVAATEEILSPQEVRRVFLLPPSLGRVPAHRSVRQDHEIGLVPLQGVLDECAAAAVFDVVRMGPDR